jgi:hypothetical protein
MYKRVICKVFSFLLRMSRVVVGQGPYSLSIHYLSYYYYLIHYLFIISLLATTCPWADLRHRIQSFADATLL